MIVASTSKGMNNENKFTHGYSILYLCYDRFFSILFLVKSSAASLSVIKVITEGLCAFILL